jgi:hypothetical protein
MVRYRRITNKELRDVVADYAAAFSNWSFHETSFVREHGPIRQTVWFEALRTGAYRPNHGISVVALPLIRMLPQMLDIRHREVKLSQHKLHRAGIITAMKEQFKPDISKPLDMGEVLALCEGQVRDTTNDLAMLAVLYAWQGRSAEALDCCFRMQSCAPPALAPIPELELQIKSLGRSIANAIQAGTIRELLSQPELT